MAAQPPTLDPLTSAAGEIRTAWAGLSEPDDAVIRRQVRIIAHTPSLANEMANNHAAAEALIAEALATDGIERLAARTAAAATMAAVTAALLEWGARDDLTLGEALLVVLETLERRDG